MKMAKVKCEIGRTVSLGNFENVKITVGLERECVDDGKEVNTVFKNMLRWCKQRVEAEEMEWKL